MNDRHQEQTQGGDAGNPEARVTDTRGTAPASVQREAPPARRGHAAMLSEHTRRAFWFIAGALAVLLGVVGFFVPLLPTVPFLLLAAFCFSRSCRRCERWMLEHPRIGPHIRDWRESHAVSLRVKQIATSMMALSSLGSWWALPAPWRWLPALACAAVAAWLWRLPTRAPRA